jgi:hypothetical protein
MKSKFSLARSCCRVEGECCAGTVFSSATLVVTNIAQKPTGGLWCDCSQLNGTYVLTPYPAGALCTFAADFTAPCACYGESPVNDRWHLGLTPNSVIPGNLHLGLSLYHNYRAFTTSGCNSRYCQFEWDNNQGKYVKTGDICTGGCVCDLRDPLPSTKQGLDPIYRYCVDCDTHYAGYGALYWGKTFTVGGDGCPNKTDTYQLDYTNAQMGPQPATCVWSIAASITFQ